MSHEGAHNGEFCFDCLLTAITRMADDVSNRMLKGFWLGLPNGTMINLKHAEMIDIEDSDVMISMVGGSNVRIPTEDAAAAATIVRGIQAALGLRAENARTITRAPEDDETPPTIN